MQEWSNYLLIRSGGYKREQSGREVFETLKTWAEGHNARLRAANGR